MCKRCIGNKSQVKVDGVLVELCERCAEIVGCNINGLQQMRYYDMEYYVQTKMDC
jgi:ribosome-binding protein aMBF1 (putative translation factor)